MKDMPVIFGIGGKHLSQNEIELFAHYKPFGIILFSRNIESREQILSLTSSIHTLFGEDFKILIDQEGGRVARIREPIIREFPSPIDLVVKGDIEVSYRKAYENYFELGRELLALGINVNCAPLADLYYDFASKVIGNRSFGSDPEFVAGMCRAVCAGLRAAGVEPVLKHIPGHGRALCDSHLELPKVDTALEELESTDFLAFKLLSDLDVMLMTAHVVYDALDPTKCATLSPIVIDYIRNTIGFKDNIIMTDDVNMKALNGDLGELSQEALQAGCDIVLHCSGNFDEMLKICEALSL